ncbi:hypothetical protein LXL04_026846 [Taraxacum kok-saghyz]
MFTETFWFPFVGGVAEPRVGGGQVASEEEGTSPEEEAVRRRKVASEVKRLPEVAGEAVAGLRPKWRRHEIFRVCSNLYTVRHRVGFRSEIGPNRVKISPNGSKISQQTKNQAELGVAKQARHENSTRNRHEVSGFGFGISTPKPKHPPPSSLFTSVFSRTTASKPPKIQYFEIGRSLNLSSSPASPLRVSLRFHLLQLRALSIFGSISGAQHLRVSLSSQLTKPRSQVSEPHLAVHQTSLFKWAGNIESYAFLIDVLSVSKDLDKVKSLFIELKQKRFLMNINSVNLLIKSFGNLGMVEELLWVWKKMKENDIEPSLFTFNFGNQNESNIEGEEEFATNQMKDER